MTSYIIQFIVVTGLFVLVKYILNRFSIPYLKASGFEYICLGLSLNPNLISHSVYINFESLKIVMAFCVALIGFRLGMDLRFTDFGKVSTLSFKIAFFDIIITFIILFVSLSLSVMYLLNIQIFNYDMLLLFVTISVVGVTSSMTIAKLASADNKISKKMQSIVQYSIHFHQTLTVFLFGLIFTIFPVLGSVVSGEYETITWLWFSILLSIVFGFIYQLSLDELENEQLKRSYIFLMICISTAIAYYFKLSPILIALISGVVLNNVSRYRDTIKKEMSKTAHVATSILVIYACMTVEFRHPFISAFLLIIYIGIRYYAKNIAQKIAYYFINPEQRVTDRFSAVFISQGRLSLVLLVSFQMFYQSEWLDVIQLTIICSVILNQVLGHYSYKNLIIDYDQKIAQSG